MTTHELAEKLLVGPNVPAVMECPITYELVEVSNLCESELDYRDENNNHVKGITVRTICFEPTEDELNNDEEEDESL